MARCTNCKEDVDRNSSTYKDLGLCSKCSKIDNVRSIREKQNDQRGKIFTGELKREILAYLQKSK